MRVLVILSSLVISCVALGMTVWTLQSSRSSEAGHAMEDGRAPQTRLHDLERRVENSLSMLEERNGALLLPEVSRDNEGEGSVSEPRRIEERVADLEARLEVLEFLMEAQGEDPVTRGRSYLVSRSWRVRREGIRMLRDLGLDDPQNLDEILRLLNDPEPEVREEALKALGDEEKIESVSRMTALLADGAPGVREEAIESLAEILVEKGSEADVAGIAGRILERLTDDDRDVREEAAEALGRLKVQSAVDGLVRCLEDPEEQVREDALESLVRIKNPAAIGPLRKLYADPGGMEPIAVAAALKELGDDELFRRETTRLARLVSVGENAQIRWEALKTLAEYAGEDYRSVLEEALQDPSAIVRSEAEKVLESLR